MFAITFVYPFLSVWPLWFLRDVSLTFIYKNNPTVLLVKGKLLEKHT